MDNSKGRVSRGWDMGLDYAATKRRLLDRLRELDQKRTRGVRVRRATAYVAVCLWQLRNGSRVSEAVDAVQQWAKTRRKEVEVLVRKHRSRPEARLMVCPEELREEHRLDVASVADSIRVGNVKVYARDSLGFNTHSLRYARITRLLEQGVSPSIVAKITHHRRLDYILRYTQQRAADEISRQID